MWQEAANADAARKQSPSPQATNTLDVPSELVRDEASATETFKRDNASPIMGSQKHPREMEPMAAAAVHIENPDDVDAVLSQVV